MSGYSEEVSQDRGKGVMLIRFETWHKHGSVAINPAHVVMVEQQGHMPPASKIIMDGGTEHIVDGNFTLVVDLLNGADDSRD